MTQSSNYSLTHPIRHIKPPRIISFLVIWKNGSVVQDLLMIEEEESVVGGYFKKLDGSQYKQGI